MTEMLQRDQVLEWRRYVGCRKSGVFEYFFHTASGDWYARGRSVKEAIANAKPYNTGAMANRWGKSKSKAKKVEK
jgi:hypothetical protein